MTIPQTIDKEPIKMQTKCCSIVKGTSFKALPPNSTINNWQMKILTTIKIKM